MVGDSLGTKHSCAAKQRRIMATWTNSWGVEAFIQTQVIALFLNTSVRTNALTPHGNVCLQDFFWQRPPVLPRRDGPHYY